MGLDKFETVKKKLEEANQLYSELTSDIEEKQESLKKKLLEINEKSRAVQYNQEELQNFVNEPYVVIPKKKEEWYIVAPKFIDFQIGWLESSSDSYNIFVVNKFMDWLSDIPADLKDRLKFPKKLPLKLFDGMVLTGEENQGKAWDRYKTHLSKREGKDRLKIKRGHEFKLMAKMIDDGILPFIPTPVADEDKRTPNLSYTLRGYQQDALNKFMEYGAIGVYWAFSAGKTFIGMAALSSINGKKLVVVPTRVLKEQWISRINKYTDLSWGEVEVHTYAAYRKLHDKEYSLIVFDEAHRLPANTYSRLATIRAKYRMGLSASPYREDGRTEYIFALTGFPVGLDWTTLMKLGVFQKPDIVLYLLKDKTDKARKLGELLKLPLKTMVFCDSIQWGNTLSKKFEIPFVHGQSSKRLEVIKNSQATIVSRVGDEGVSIKELERVIEIDFLFGSRRQESQRMGRVFHGEKKGQHIILMTEEEYHNYEKRLYAIYEKGFKIDIRR